MKPASPRLEIENLGRRIDGRWLWRGLAFNIGKGEQVAVTGPSGSGKSQLLRILAGLDDPDEGELRFDGKPLPRTGMPGYRARVMYLHQRSAMTAGNVEDNLRAPFRFQAHRERSYDREACLALLRTVGRGPAFLAKDAAELSGGEAQIAALMRALVLDPEILLLDEPTASLDDRSRAGMETLVREWLWSRDGRACLWTSHDDAQLKRVADRRIALAEPVA